MQPDRREFLRHIGWVTGAGTGLLATRPAFASDHGHTGAPADAMGVLVDLTVCIGCRLCEHACKKSNGFEPGPVESYDDQTVFNQKRRPTPDAYTVVNSWTNPKDRTKQIYVKTNCLHCNRPACVSACLVGALRKRPMGAVTYDAWKCIGCRYCMVACPFQIPAYDYHDALTPQVRKCQLCFHRTHEEGVLPECVAACPRQTMVYGRRSELLELAKEKIKAHPNDYVDHIYGEHEVGGTNWLYLSSVPFERIGFVKLPSDAPPAITEAIQHGVFKHGIPPLTLYGLLGTLMYLTRPRRPKEVVREAQDVTEARPEQTQAENKLPVYARGAALSLAGADGGTIVLDGPPTVGDRRERQGADPPKRPVRSHGHPADEHAEHHEEPMPVRQKLLTPGVIVLLGLAMTGLAFGLKPVGGSQAPGGGGAEGEGGPRRSSLPDGHGVRARPRLGEGREGIPSGARGRRTIACIASTAADHPQGRAEIMAPPVSRPAAHA